MASSRVRGIPSAYLLAALIGSVAGILWGRPDTVENDQRAFRTTQVGLELHSRTRLDAIQIASAIREDPLAVDLQFRTVA
jgi:hypothetical protein